MTFHLDKGGVKLQKSYRKVLRSFKTFYSTTIREELLPRLTAATLVLGMVPVSVFALDEQPALLAYDASQNGLVFTTTQVSPLGVKETVPVTIKIGESQAQAEARKARTKAQRLEQANSGQLIAADPGFVAKRALVQQAANAYNIPWQILEAVWQVESGKAWQTAARSGAGAAGPAQFMPATWRHYAVDGNHDGVKDITLAEDAIYAAARYLAANGADRGEIYQALYAYNHAGWYVEKVLRIAREIGYIG